jgi:hypothetical protein
MYHISVSCLGLTDQECITAVPDILEEFSHRDWHMDPHCNYNDSVLTLTVINDFDENGQATIDEFIDAVHACIKFNGTIRFILNYAKLV